MNLIFSSSIPPPLLEEVPHTFFSSRNSSPTAPRTHRHTPSNPVCIGSLNQ